MERKFTDQLSCDLTKVVPSSPVVASSDKVIKKEYLDLVHNGPNHRIKPMIHVNKTAGIVESIEILCTCGEKITIAIEYEKM